MTTTNGTIHLTDLVPGEHVGFKNPRSKSGMDKASLKELSADILTRGLETPLRVWMCEHEGAKVNVLTSGHRRCLAIEMLTKTEYKQIFPEGIPSQLYEGTLADAMLDAVASNIHRMDLSDYELAKQMAELVAMGHKQKDLAIRLNKSQSWVSKHLGAFQSAAPALKKAWEGEKIPTDSVFDLATLPEDEQESAVADAVAERESGGRKGKGKARAKAKAKAGKSKGQNGASERASLSDLRHYASLLAEVSKKESPMTAGFRDGILFAMGTIGVGDFDKEVKTWISRSGKTKAAQEKAEAAAEA